MHKSSVCALRVRTKKVWEGLCYGLLYGLPGCLDSLIRMDPVSDVVSRVKGALASDSSLSPLSLPPFECWTGLLAASSKVPR